MRRMNRQIMGYSTEDDNEDEVDNGDLGGGSGGQLEVMSGRLSLVHRESTTLPFSIIDKHWHWVTTLDLSHNRIS